MANPVKIFEIKGSDFPKGLSHFSDFPFAGWFNQASFDPFEDYGYFTPPLAEVVTDSSRTSTPKFITSWVESGVSKLYVHTGDKLFEVLDDSPYTTTDESAEITVSAAVGGVASFKNKYIYAHPSTSKVFANAFPVASGSNVEILSSAGSTEFYRPMCVAPDKNLYIGDFSQINQITNVAGTSGNTVAYYNLESGFMVRDMVSDGNYLIVIADNNTSHKIASDGDTGSFRCQVLFYDVNNGRPTADFIHEFTESYLTSVKVLDDGVYIFGKDNLWICNSQTKPRAIFNFQTGSTITEPPRHFFQVSQKNNIILWCGVTNNKIFGYGSKVIGQKKVFIQPYGTASAPQVILLSGSKVYVGTNGNNQMLVVLNTGSTRGSATLATANTLLDTPFKFAFAKVILKNKLATGCSVGFGLNSQDESAKISNFVTKTFAEIGAKQSILFNISNDASNSAKMFNEISVTCTVTKSSVQKIEVWGYPIESNDQTI
jgi:hypothetical protein